MWSPIVNILNSDVDVYEGDKGKLRLISDICVGYDNAKTVSDFKKLIDEIKNIADNQL